VRATVLWLLLLFVLSSSAFADFINLDELSASQTPASLDRVKLASVSIGGCVGTLISNDGYLITALHCVTGFPIFDSVRESEFGTILFRVDLAKVRLHLAVDGQVGPPTKPVSPNQLVEKAKIIAAGRGFFSSSLDNLADYKKDPKKFQRLMDAGYGIPEDWAIVKIDRANASCVKTNSSPLQLGQPVWSVNFSTREKSVSDQKSSQYFSSGIVTRGIEDSVAFQNWLKVQRGSLDQTASIYKSVMNRPGSYAATVDAIPGSSGSGLLNSAGELVGVISDAEWFNENGYAAAVPGSTQGATLESILPKIREQLSPEEFGKIFNCLIE
jgi:hypothetical protein